MLGASKPPNESSQLPCISILADEDTEAQRSKAAYPRDQPVREWAGIWTHLLPTEMPSPFYFRTNSLPPSPSPSWTFWTPSTGNLLRVLSQISMISFTLPLRWRQEVDDVFTNEESQAQTGHYLPRHITLEWWSWDLEFVPRKFHEQRSLARYSPWGCKESDTEHVHMQPCWVPELQS